MVCDEVVATVTALPVESDLRTTYICPATPTAVGRVIVSAPEVVSTLTVWSEVVSVYAEVFATYPVTTEVVVPPGMLIVFVAPVPEAVTPAPVKFSVVPDGGERAALVLHCDTGPPPPDAAMVIVSPGSSGVMVTFVPATSAVAMVSRMYSAIVSRRP